MSKKKISILLPNLKPGGAEKVNLDLALEFSKRGFQVQIVLMNSNGELLDNVKDKFDIQDLQCSRVRNFPKALFKYFRNFHPKVLIVSLWPLTAITPIINFLSGLKCKVMICEHNTLSYQYKKWGWTHYIILRLSMMIGYRLANIRIGVSEGVANDMAKLSLMCRKKFSVIYNPVSLKSSIQSKVNLKKIEKLWSCPPGERILTVGSLKPQKNHKLLLQAFAKVNLPNSRLMIVGKGDEHMALLKLSKELKISKKVIFAGFQYDPTPFYKTADLFILSSNYEGFGNVLVEALACGTPVISTNCRSGPSEILDNGRYGRLVSVGNLNELVEAIKIELKFFENNKKNLLIRRANDFLPEISAEKYLKLINEMY